MTTKHRNSRSPDMNRRDFLTTTAAVGGAMVLGFHLPSPAMAATDPGSSPGIATRWCLKSTRG